MESVLDISEGKIKGCIREDLNGKKFHAFLGVPYGKPPIGPLRFKAPLPVEPWTGVKDCTKDGNRCYHRDIITNEYAGSEDCLVLNVFTQSIQVESNLKPVMFYIYGGGFIVGSNETNVFGPEHLLTEDIVLVTVNYRLGALGFLSIEDPTLNVPGNAGLKDQVLALKWVQKNIKNFGGNPNNVTIFGESAGAASVHFHILSEQSKELFHKAIMQSGVVFNPWSWGTPGCKHLIEKLDRQDTINEEEALDILRNLTVEELYKIQEKCFDDIIPSLKRPFGPVIEKPNPTAIIMKDPIDIIKSGNYNQVPMIIGYNSLEGMFVEGGYFFFPDTHKTTLKTKECIPWTMGLSTKENQRDTIVHQLNEFYRKDPIPNDTYNLESDSLFVTGIVAAVQYHLKTTKAPIYLYRFDFDGELNALKPILQNYSSHKLVGACHADELGYLFKNATLPNCKPNSKESTILKNFVKMWTNFANTGNPTPDPEAIVDWEPVEDEYLQYLDIGNTLSMKEEPDKDRIDFWKKLCKTNHTSDGYLL